MNDKLNPQAAEQQFFHSLVGSDVSALERILSVDFLLIDVLTGSEVGKPDLLTVLRLGQLKFDAIEPIDLRFATIRLEP